MRRWRGRSASAPASGDDPPEAARASGPGAAMTRPIRRRTQSAMDHGRQPPRRTLRGDCEGGTGTGCVPFHGCRASATLFGFLAGRSRNILPSRPMETAYSQGNDRAVFPI